MNPPVTDYCRSLFLVATLLYVGLVSALDGNELLEDCQAAVTILDMGQVDEELAVRSGYCLGFLEVFRTGMPLLREEYQACFPEGGITSEQAARAVVEFLQGNPAVLEEHKALLAVLALKEAYPCHSE